VIETNFNQHHDRPSSSLATPPEHGIVSGERRILCVMRCVVGGIRTYIHYNYPTLAEAGFRFTFVGPEGQSFETFSDELRGWEEPEFVGVPVDGKRFRLCSTVRRLLRTGRFTLIHSQGINTGIQAVLANAGLRIPHVMTSHDVFRPVHAQGFWGPPKLWLLGWILSQIDTIVTVGEEARRNHLEYLPRLAKNPGRVATIRPGIDSKWYAEMDKVNCTALRERFHLDPGAFLIGFLGRFMEQKGFLSLLDALESLRNDPPRFPYHVVAVGNGDFEREYRRQVQRRGLNSVVSFHDFVPDPRATLRELDLLVMPSLWEALPVLPMEAMAVGTPVLGTDCIGLHEVLTGTPSTMVPAGDSAALARALKSAIENPFSEMAERFCPEARRRFEVKASSAQLLQLFRQNAHVKIEPRVAAQPVLPRNQ